VSREGKLKGGEIEAAKYRGIPLTRYGAVDLASSILCAMNRAQSFL